MLVTSPLRSFAIVPAAGHSARMGQPKLLLPLAGRPLILHTLAAWLSSRVDKLLIVVRADDTAIAAAIELVADPRIVLVRPGSPPPDMKASIQAALHAIEQDHQPREGDAFLVAPADMPEISPAIIDLLIEKHANQPDRILAPTLAGSRGHPVLFPWRLGAEVYALATDEGLNAIVRCHPPVEIACDHLRIAAGDPFADIDTPEQYRRLAGEQPPGEPL